MHDVTTRQQIVYLVLHRNKFTESLHFIFTFEITAFQFLAYPRRLTFKPKQNNFQ